MNFKNILQEIEKADQGGYQKLTDRRGALKSFGSKMALASMPLVVGSLFKKAYGKTTLSTVFNVLNFLLELEYFEYNYYHQANNTGALIAVADQPGFALIEAQEKNQLNFLRSLINNMGGIPFTPSGYTANPVTGNPYSPSSYDFTAGNQYAVFNNYGAFLTMAQTFEDTMVRAYQGQLPDLLGYQSDVLIQVLQLSSVDARHASFVRLVRRNAGAIDVPKPWITNNIPPSSNLQAFYLGEDNQTQRGINIYSLPGVSGDLSETNATEAFDEPLDMATVNSLLAPFMM